MLKNQNMDSKKKILVCRTDDLKSLVLTIPVFSALKKLYPGAHIGALTSPSTAPILKNNPFIDHIIVDDKDDSHKGAAGFVKLSKEIEHHKFDTAIIAYSNWRLLSLAVSAGIKKRIANGFRPYLPLINQPVWLHKSHPPINETNYVMSFVNHLKYYDGEINQPVIYLTESEKKNALKWLKEKTENKNNIIGIHPRTANPAFTLSLDMWVRIARQAANFTNSESIIITGTKDDKTIAERICKAIGKNAISIAGELNLRQLCAVQSCLKLYIAPNCGLFQTAAASGTSVLGLFPPLISLSKTKWKPDNAKVQVLQPNLEKLCVKCNYSKCRLYPCLDTITPEDINKALENLIP